MTTLTPLTPRTAPAAVAPTLEAVSRKFGMLPNVIATMAHAPAALNGYLALSETLAGGRLDGRQREIVALAVAQANACDYCLAAHTLMGRGAGLGEDDIRLARQGSAANATDAAIARYARDLTRHRGRLSPGELAALRRDGLDDGLLVEIVAHVALNQLTNFLNHVAATEVDFPPVGV